MYFMKKGVTKVVINKISKSKTEEIKKDFLICNSACRLFSLTISINDVL